MIRLLLAALLIATASAAPTRADWFVGGYILENLCNRADTDECDGYIVGLIDSLDPVAQASIGDLRACIPTGTTAEGARQAVLDYLSGSPAIRDINASVIVALALSEAFPCE